MSEGHEVPYVVVEKRGAGLGPFLLGSAFGAVLALLYAPKAGKEMQEDLKEGLRRVRDDAERKFTEVRGDVEETYVRVRSDVADRVDVAREDLLQRRVKAEEAVRAGRDAARSARGDLEQRVAESKANYKDRIAARAQAVEEVAEELEEASETE